MADDAAGVAGAAVGVAGADVGLSDPRGRAGQAFWSLTAGPRKRGHQCSGVVREVRMTRRYSGQVNWSSD